MNNLGGISKVVNGVNGLNGNSSMKIRGKVVLMKSSILDFNDPGASAIDRASEFLGQGVSLQLVSAVHAESDNALKGKVGKKAYLEDWNRTLPSLTAGETAFSVTFDYEEAIGLPGAIIVSNNHNVEFFLKYVTLEDFPDHGIIHFDCNSWLYPQENYGYDRVFFTNKTYVLHDMPVPLLYYREHELVNLRGDGTGERQVYDRIYDYALYNDLGDPDKGELFVRPILGGSTDYPYPRRGRTGRPPTQTDPNTESRLPLIRSLSIYVPRDERFGHLKMSDFLVFAVRAVAQAIRPALEGILDGTESWDSFEEIDNLYRWGFKLPVAVIDYIRKNVPLEILKDIVETTPGGQFLKYPLPHVIKEDKSAWRTDEEFGREMMAGVNPLIIKRLEKFPPTSNLDPRLYGDQSSKITVADIEKNMAGMSVTEALSKNKLFILDHHDSLMPYLTRINATSSKVYASRTILFLQADDTLKPVAIELSLPNPEGDQYGAVSQVFTPAEEGVEAAVWQLAKAFVAVDDSGIHQLISHWLHTHASIEPFVIATNRQLSAVHPIYKLLQPHFRDTMNINALARTTLINAEGILELTVFPRKYSMEMSAVLYKDWVFPEQALPADLLKRGVAIEDKSATNGVRLLIKDYPYAVDGLEIWSAIKTWVKEYSAFYYTSDQAVQRDVELQAWWKELRDVGHGDKKDAPWWPTMQSHADLVESCTTMIWMASALHAAVNFGQYPYAGYVPNRPTVSRRFMPEPGTQEYEELKNDPEAAFLNTITPELQSLIGMSLIEVLSRHASDEVYLGKRDSEHWTTDAGPMEAFEQFGKNLTVIEGNIIKRNKDASLKNRAGPVKFPYTLLFPTSTEGLTAKGIPNSVSI